MNDRFIAAVLYGYCSEYERINRNSMLSYRTINYQNQLVTFHLIQGKQFSLLLRLVSLEHIPSTEILCIFVLLLKLAVSCHLMGQNIDSVTQHHPQQIVTYISLLANATFPVGWLLICSDVAKHNNPILLLLVRQIYYYYYNFIYFSITFNILISILYNSYRYGKEHICTH